MNGSNARAEDKAHPPSDEPFYKLDPWVEESFRSSLNANRTMFSDNESGAAGKIDCDRPEE